MSALSLPDFWAGPTHSLSDAELLLLLLAGPEPSPPSPVAVQIARVLLERFGCWRAIVRAPPEELLSIAGLGPAKLARLGLLTEMARRLERTRPPVFSDSGRVAAVVREVLPEEQESVAAVFLNADQSLIRVKEIFRGSVSECFAQPREILLEAIKAGAARLIVAHNHVAGGVLPSEADVRFTTRLEWAARLIGIPLTDHLILGREGAFFSFSDAGLMKPRRASRRSKRGR